MGQRPYFPGTFELVGSHEVILKYRQESSLEIFIFLYWAMEEDDKEEMEEKVEEDEVGEEETG